MLKPGMEKMKEILFICFVLRNTLCSESKCPYDHFVKCDISLPKSPVAFLSSVSHTGVNEAECFSKMTSFEWALAVVCPSSLFCGFGVDLNRNYFSEGINVFAPLEEHCHIIADSHKTDCDTITNKLYKSGILRGELIDTDMKGFHYEGKGDQNCAQNRSGRVRPGGGSGATFIGRQGVKTWTEESSVRGAWTGQLLLDPREILIAKVGKAVGCCLHCILPVRTFQSKETSPHSISSTNNSPKNFIPIGREYMK